MATIKDIAKMAGVSISTVSHAVNKTRYVSPELEARIQNAILELDYPPNFIIKKSIANNNNKYVVFLKTGSASYLERNIETQIESEMRKTSFSFISLNFVDEQSLSSFEPLLLGNSNVAGIIAFPGDETEKLLAIIAKHSLPTVLLTRPIEGVNAGFVFSDTENGTSTAIRHLLRNGHEQIAFLSSSPPKSTWRYDAYCKTLKEFSVNINPELSYSGLKSNEDVFSALKSLFELELAPTAIFAATYSVIAPLFQYINSNNILCPKDISVVCLNDFEWAKLHSPSITAVRQDVSEMAKTSVNMLLARINEAKDSEDVTTRDNHCRKVPTKLIVRSSTSGIARGPFGEKAQSVKTLQLSEAESSAVSKHNYTAAISFHYTGKAFMDLILKGITAIFKTLNISLIATTDAHFNPQLQSRQLDSLLLLEPDIIISLPTDNKKTSDAFRRVVESKSKLILITNVPDGITHGDYVSCISINERSHGRNIGYGLGEYMLNHDLHNVALLKHSADFYATNQRDAAAEQILQEEYEDICICGSEGFLLEGDVYDATTNLIRRHPETEALYTSWEGPALEAMRALTDLGRNNIAVATGDLDYTTALVLAHGGMIKAISAQCPYEQGEAIALAAAKTLLGKTVPSFIGIEPIRVTHENLLKTWQNIYKEDPPLQLKEALKANPDYFSKMATLK